MDGEFPEQFKCPICFEIPEKEIYQCENGHTVCHICVKGLSLCPQCRVDIKTKKIRNRGLEDILDMMIFNCSFKTEGCTTKVTRREMSSHNDNCSFGGEQVPLCAYLGYAFKYKVKSRMLQESHQHLKQEHSILSKNTNIVEIKLTTVTSFDRKVKGLWKPVLLKLQSNHYLLAVYLVTGNISFSCISIGGDGDSEAGAKFGIQSKNSKVPALEWIAKPVPHTDCEMALKYPPLLVSMESLLSAYVDKNVLKIEVVLIGSEPSNVISNKEVVELDPCTTLPSQKLHQHDELTQLDGVSFEDMVFELLAHFGDRRDQLHRCNVCRTLPIRGPLYKCLQCLDYDLCSECFIKNEHSFHHFAFIYTNDQSAATWDISTGSHLWEPFVEFKHKNDPATGYIFGSAHSDAKDLRCQKCENQPDFICLQCRGPWGLCRYCFLGELRRHDGSHLFVITMTDSARQFALHFLRKENTLPNLKHELRR